MSDSKIPIKELTSGTGYYVPHVLSEKTFGHRPIKQCFRIDASLVEAMDNKQIKETVEDLRMLGLHKAPYLEFKIELMHKTGGSEYILEYEYYMDDFDPDVGLTIVSRLYRNNKFMEPFDYPEGLMKHMDRLTYLLFEVLVCLLATKNVVKKITRNKLAKFGVGKQKTEYTTTLHIGKMQTEYEKGEPTGLTLRPHWRRGHARTQHYGPHNQMIKQIWVEPVFVNSDKEYTGERIAYNVIK